MKHRYFLVFLFMGLGLAGCNNQAGNQSSGPKSPLVQKVEAAGAGDVTNVSREALDQWFVQHKELATEITNACIPVRKNAPASWGDSVEAKVCTAASDAAPFQHVTGSGKKY